MGIVHGILSQPQHFLPSWPPMLTKNKQLQGWFGPNDIWKWLQIVAEAFQSLNWFMSKVYKAWDGNYTLPFSSKDTIECQANPQIWPKTNSLRAMLAQITCVHHCRLLQKYSKVKLSSQTLITKPGIGIVHCILSQSQHILLSWPPVLAKTEQLWGWFGPNHMYTWLQTASEALHSQNWFIKRSIELWMGIIHGVFIQTHHLLPSWPPNLA